MLFYVSFILLMPEIVFGKVLPFNANCFLK